MTPRKHVFVCISKRPPFAKPSCGPRGSEDVLAALGEALAQRGLLGEVAVNGSTCLGPCESGPTLVVYPDGVWYRGVSVADVAEIVQSHLVEGRPVARLLLAP